jgi:hypothetical protein
MNFDLDKIYYTRISAASFANLSPAVMERIFSDGRHISPFIEAFIDQNFDNISYVPGNKAWDYRYASSSLNKPLELRGFPLQAKTANLIPSNMIGAGRSYDETKYLAKLNSISGYIFVYPVINYQNLLVFGYSADKIANTIPLLQKIDRKYVQSILKVSPNAIAQYMNDPAHMSVVENVVYEVDVSKIVP